MTADPYTHLASPDREAAVRRRVQVVAYLSLAGAVAGVFMGVNGRIEYADGRSWAGMALLAVSIVVAAGCVRHGMRHDHERGRWVAMLAVVVGLVGVVLVLGDMARDFHFGRFPPGPNV